MDQSIWAIYDSFPSVTTVLQRDKFTLSDVLSHESVIQDVKFGRDGVIQYFNHPAILEQMLKFITQAEPRYQSEEAQLKHKEDIAQMEQEYGPMFHKFPYVCTEIVAGANPLAETIINDDHLLTIIFDFLKSSTPPLNPACTGYFRRLCTALLTNNNQKLVDTIVSKNLIHSFIAHLDSYSIMELVIMTGWDDGLRQYTNPTWIQTSGLLPGLLDCMDNNWILPQKVQEAVAAGLLTPSQVLTYREDVSSHAGRVLIDLIIKCPDSDAVQWLLEEDNIDRLIEFGFSSSPATAGGAISLLILLSQHVLAAFQMEAAHQRAYQQYLESQNPHHPHQHPLNSTEGAMSGLDPNDGHPNHKNNHTVSLATTPIRPQKKKQAPTVQRLRFFYKPTDPNDPESPLEPIYKHDYGIDCGQEGCKHLHLATGSTPKHIVSPQEYEQLFNLREQQRLFSSPTPREIVFPAEPLIPPPPNGDTHFLLLLPPTTMTPDTDYATWVNTAIPPSDSGVSMIKLPKHYIIDKCRSKLPLYLQGAKPKGDIPTHIHHHVVYGPQFSRAARLKNGLNRHGFVGEEDPCAAETRLAEAEPVSNCKCDEIEIFGDVRMKHVELVSILLSESDSSIIHYLADRKSFDTLIELFFYYPWHTLLHSMIETVIYYIGRGVYTCHPHFLFLKTKFLSSCMTLFKYNLLYIQQSLAQGLCIHLDLAKQLYDVSLYQEQNAQNVKSAPSVTGDDSVTGDVCLAAEDQPYDKPQRKSPKHSKQSAKHNNHNDDNNPEDEGLDHDDDEEDHEPLDIEEENEQIAAQENALPAIAYTGVSNLSGHKITSLEHPLRFTAISNYSSAQYHRLTLHPYYQRFSSSSLRSHQCRAGCIAFLDRILTNINNIISESVFLNSLDTKVMNQLIGTYNHIVAVYCTAPPSQHYYKQMTNGDEHRDDTDVDEDDLIADDDDAQFGFDNLLHRDMMQHDRPMGSNTHHNADPTDFALSSIDDLDDFPFNQQHQQMPRSNDQFHSFDFDDMGNQLDMAQLSSNIGKNTVTHSSEHKLEDEDVDDDDDDDDADGFVNPEDARIWF